jgi:hypothetical protein
MLTRLQTFDFACFEGPLRDPGADKGPRIELAVVLDEISLSAATLSDRLAMRYFSHVGEFSRQTFAS